jgi:hypothetical protein
MITLNFKDMKNKSNNENEVQEILQSSKEKFASFDEAKTAMLEIAINNTPIESSTPRGIKVASSKEYEQREARVQYRDDVKTIVIGDVDKIANEKGFTTLLRVEDRNALKKASKLYGWKLFFDNKRRMTFVQFPGLVGDWFRVEKQWRGDNKPYLWARIVEGNTKKYIQVFLEPFYQV